MQAGEVNITNRQRIQYRTFYFTSFLGASMMLYLALMAWGNQDYFALLGNVIGVALLLTTGLQANKETPPPWTAWPFALYLTAYLTVLCFVGYHKGEALIWLMVVPPVALLILGTRLGLLISTYVFLLLCYSLFYSGQIPDQFMIMEYKIRLCFVYMLVTTLCYAYSYVSDVSEQALQAAAARIENLEQLLPMCAHCKNVRTENGWHSIESYLQQASETTVSHGICPNCLTEHFSDV
ncbi:MAG: hypothetical protein KDI36_16050 [Pseudomonadales bacterium]|nr:hypothetical protein [Pseudomonadales bacterium]